MFKEQSFESTFRPEVHCIRQQFHWDHIYPKEITNKHNPFYTLQIDIRCVSYPKEDWRAGAPPILLCVWHWQNIIYEGSSVIFYSQCHDNDKDLKVCFLVARDIHTVSLLQDWCNLESACQRVSMSFTGICPPIGFKPRKGHFFPGLLV